MGTFLAVTSVIGKTKSEVVNSLTHYANIADGGLQQEDIMNAGTPNCCIIDEVNGNISILYPGGYLEWDDSSQFISKELQAPVFSFHIHDGDLWMYVLYNNGNVVDQFNPVPDYWDGNLAKEEIQKWKGDAKVIASLIPFIKTTYINKYLVRWNLDEDEPSKAYPLDEFAKEDWQLVDFMRKLKLPFPIDDNGNPKGQTYKLWTRQLKLVNEHSTLEIKQENNPKKSWWKFW